MERETYSDELIASVISLKYFAYKIDVDNGEGLKMSEKYEVFQLPTTLFLDYNGKVLGRLKGFYSPEYFIKMLEMNQNKQGSIFGKKENFDRLIMSL